MELNLLKIELCNFYKKNMLDLAISLSVTLHSL